MTNKELLDVNKKLRKEVKALQKQFEEERETKRQFGNQILNIREAIFNTLNEEEGCFPDDMGALNKLIEQRNMLKILLDEANERADNCNRVEQDNSMFLRMVRKLKALL